MTLPQPNEPVHDPTYEPTDADWLDAAESVLRELREGRDIADPHFRHWAQTKILSYFAAKGEIPA